LNCNIGKGNVIVIVNNNIRRRESGQAMVELAIVLPVLLMLVLGIIQYGILFNHSLTLTDAVRAGARQGAVSRVLPGGPATAAAAADARVRSAASGSLSGANDPTALIITVTSTFAQGSDVTVKATYPYEINIFGVPVKTGRFTSQTTERVE
jgi:Flp pilus assembly protein TadG